jgi:hypothetical protein
MNLGLQSVPPSAVLVFVLAAPILFVLLLSLYRRREGIKHRLHRTIVGELAYVGVAAYLATQHVPPIAAIAIGILAGFAVQELFVAPRSRHIRASEKRKAIARHERKTGRKYDPKADEFDHEIAFARGGSGTADNLRIRTRAENRRKGKKSPWWDLLGR